MSRPEIQTYIPGTEPPPDAERDHDTDEIVYAWLDAKQAQRTAAGDTKLKHAVMLARFAELRTDRYPYVDRFTGKKRYVVIASEPKATSTKAPAQRKPRKRKGRDERDVVTLGEVTEESGDASDAVEHRKVSRKSVEKEIDPFASTRGSMEGSAP